MADILGLAADNILSPMVLFFVLGFAASMVRSDLSFPESVSKAIALYLMMAIGFKGGVEINRAGVNFELLATLAAGIMLGMLLPLVSYVLLRITSRVGGIDAAAIAAHYGSISVVTFIAGSEMLEAASIPYDGFMVAVMAAMETPAILIGLFLARFAASRDGTILERAAGTPATSLGSSIKLGPAPRPGIAEEDHVSNSLLREVFLNGSVVVLVGAFVVGAITGQSGYDDLKPFVVDPFKGVLCLFLLDLGLLAATRLRSAQGLDAGLIIHGLTMPLIGASAGLGAGYLIGLDLGSMTLLAVLTASASYIAVPAAMRLALPQANPGYYVTLSLAVTFPFNLTVGLPLYLAAAQALSVG